MKKSTRKGVAADEIFQSTTLSGSPNKFASQCAAGSTVVVLEPDVAAAFPSSGEVNEALRALAGRRRGQPPGVPSAGRVGNLPHRPRRRGPLSRRNHQRREVLWRCASTMGPKTGMTMV